MEKCRIISFCLAKLSFSQNLHGRRSYYQIQFQTWQNPWWLKGPFQKIYSWILSVSEIWKHNSNSLIVEFLSDQHLQVCGTSKTKIREMNRTARFLYYTSLLLRLAGVRYSTIRLSDRHYSLILRIFFQLELIDQNTWYTKNVSVKWKDACLLTFLLVLVKGSEIVTILLIVVSNNLLSIFLSQIFITAVRWK